jgi:hypothetical protein
MIAEGLQKLLDMIQPPIAPNGGPTDKKGNQYVVVRDGYTIKGLEPPSAAQRVHRFTDLRSFAEWLLRHADPKLTEISVGDEEVMAVLNGKQVHPDRITCELVKHPTFEAWEDALNVEIGQVAFHQLVRANRESLGAGAEDLMSSLSQMKAVSGGEVEVHIDPTGFTKFSGRKNTLEVEGAVPPEIRVVTPVYDGVEREEDDGEGGDALLQEYILDVLVRMNYQADNFTFKLIEPALELVMRSARRDVKRFLDRLLASETTGEFLVGMGTLSGHEVKRIEE